MVAARTTRKASDPERFEAARKLAIDAAIMAANTHCTDIVVLDVRGLSPITDFLVICTGTSAPQMRAVAREVTDMAHQRGDRALSSDGIGGETSLWILVDFVDVVLHIFNTEGRLYYDLENLWGDARRVEWKSTSA